MAQEVDAVDTAEPEEETQVTEETQDEQSSRAEEERYKKEIAGLNRKISELEKARKETEQAGMTELEKLQARLQDMEKSLSEQRVIALREQIAHRSGLDSEDMDLVTATDEDGITTQVERILAIRDRARTEAVKERDRNNGRRITTSKEQDNLTYADLVGMTDQQLAKIPNAVKDAIMERALNKE